MDVLAYAACWATTLIFGPSAVRNHLPRELPGHSDPIPFVEEFEETDEMPGVPQHLRHRDWVFVGRVKCWVPFLVSADLAVGGPGYATASRYHVLWLPGFSSTVGSQFYWQSEW